MGRGSALKALNSPRRSEAECCKPRTTITEVRIYELQACSTSLFLSGFSGRTAYLDLASVLYSIIHSIVLRSSVLSSVRGCTV